MDFQVLVEAELKELKFKCVDVASDSSNALKMLKSGYGVHYYDEALYIGSLIPSSSRLGARESVDFFQRVKNLPTDKNCHVKLRNMRADLEDGTVKIISHSSGNSRSVVDGKLSSFDPPRLMSWSVESIPTKIDIEGEEVNFKTYMLKRLNDEAGCFCVTHVEQLAWRLLDETKAQWKTYIAYVKMYGGEFDITYRSNAPQIHPVCDDLLCASRLQMTITCTVYKRLIPFGQRDVSVLDEIFDFVFVDPIQNSSTLSGLFAPFLNVTPAESNKMKKKTTVIMHKLNICKKWFLCGNRLHLFRLCHILTDMQTPPSQKCPLSKSDREWCGMF